MTFDYHLRPGVATDRLASRFLSRHEAEELQVLPAELRYEAFFHCWARKEAFVKVGGKGLSGGMKGFDLTVDPRRPPRVLGVRPGADGAADWFVADVDAGPGYAAAVAAEPPVERISCWAWEPPLGGAMARPAGL